MKCLACGAKKDINVKEFYPYSEDGFIDDPVPPLLALDCEPWEEITEADRKWRRVLVCHECFHKLSPDMWISSQCWAGLSPVTPFGELPLALIMI
jgi:hypothetical protein